MSNRPTNLFRQFSYFSNKVDAELLEKCGAYDRTLVHANTVRLLVTVTFVFLLSLYGLSTLLPLWMAAIGSALLAAVAYGFDIAILGYEWTLHRSVSRFWLINGPAVFLIKAAQLTPRLLYALVIAYGVATLAEIAFQHKAIDRDLRLQTRELNSEYFRRLDALKGTYEKQAGDAATKIADLESSIARKRDPTSEQSRKFLKERYEASAKNVNDLTARVEAIQAERIKALTALSPLREQANELESIVAESTRQMALELESPRCDVPGDKVCEGTRWEQFKNQRIGAEQRLSNVHASITSLEASLKDFESALKSTEEELKTAFATHATHIAAVSGAEDDGRSLVELQSELTKVQGERTALDTQYASDQTTLRDELRSAGFFDPAEYDIFDRYVALRAIHQDVERGAAAREVSYGIKAIVIFIELVPAFVVVFFMPFSFYASRMRERRDAELFHDHKKRMDRDLLLNINKRKHDAEVLNQKAKLYHAQQVYRERRHAAKVEADLAIAQKAREASGNSIDNEIVQEKKRIVLEAEKRKRMQAEHSTRIMGDALKREGA